MRHAGAAKRFNQSFLDDAVFNIQRELASTLLRCTPAHAMCKTGNIFDFLRFNPLRLFRNRSCAVLRALSNRAHHFDFFCVDHLSLLSIFKMNAKRVIFI